MGSAFGFGCAMDLCRRLLIPFFLFIQPFGASAWEIPSFDCAIHDLTNSASFFDHEVNKRLDSVIESVNSDEVGCDKDKFLKDLSVEVASSWFGNLEQWALDAPVSKCSVPLARSTYRDMGWLDSPILNMVGLHPVVNINGHYIGVDKLAHFMNEGLEYYRNELKGKSIDQLLAIGIREEEGIMGLSTTGIKSYGDMSANYYGYLFWKNLVSGPAPYVKCQKGKWKRIRDFQWEDYVSDLMDETVNCNSYLSESIEKLIHIRAGQLYSSTGANLKTSCPVRPDECVNIYRHLNSPKLAQVIIHPRCLREAESKLKEKSLSQASEF